MQLFVLISRIIYMVLIGRVALAVPRGGQEPLPLKVAPSQPGVTAAFHLQSRRDSDCQMWVLLQLHDTININWNYAWIHYNIAIRSHLMI